MPFPPHLLYDEETVALDLRPHWWYFSRHILTGVPLAILVILTTAIPSGARNIVRYPVAALVLLWAVSLGFKYLQWICTYFVVTDQRVLSRAGVLARRGVEIPLDRITNIDFHQGLWERVIGTGDLDVESAGHESDTHFSNVRRPDDVQNEIYREIDLNTRRESGAGAEAIGEAVARAVHGHAGLAGGGVADKIEQLARLRDEGHITPDEFERRKNDLLDQL
jgi:uncharacterized membrane protein YdbT with pleckstrin-like domain